MPPSPLGWYSLEKLCASDLAISDSDSNSGQRKKSHFCQKTIIIEKKVICNTANDS